jgi:hypothetical protein
LDGFRARFLEQVPEAARRGQVKALTQSLAPETRMAGLARLAWRIEAAPTGGVRLPGAPVAPAADWNLAAARASVEFFVAPDRDEALGRRRSEIGVTNRLHLDRELAGAFDPAPEDLLRGAGET